MSDELDRYFRCVEDSHGWVFEVALVKWTGPAQSRFTWEPFRRWKQEPTEERLARARAAALNQTRQFRTCSLCGAKRNAGHMHEETICQACAELHLGVVH